MNNGDMPIANPYVTLREEFDDWAILFNPDTGHGFGLSPTGVYVWKLFDGEHSIDDMLEALRRDAVDVPQGAGDHLFAFVEELAEQGLAGYGGARAHDDTSRLAPCPAYVPGKVSDAVKFAYEPPRLVNLSGERATGCSHCGSGSSDTDCGPGACADYGGCWSTGSTTGGSCSYGDYTGQYSSPCSSGNVTSFFCGNGTTATYSNCLDGTSASWCHTGGNT